MVPAIRQATVEDSDRIAELLNAISEEHYGEAEVTNDEVRSWFPHESLDVLVAERDGRPIGVAVRRRVAERDRAWFNIRTLGGKEQAGQGLLHELERRAAADVEPGALGMIFVRAVDETMGSVVEATGYELVRHSFRMAITTDSHLPSPVWPSGIGVATYRPEDERAVYSALDEAFSDHWEYRREPFEEWQRWHVEGPGFDPSFWFLAWDAGEVAGVSLCRIHPSGDPGHGVVNELAVRRPWRRRGLGLALLQHSFEDMRRRGMRRASLSVDGENTTGAVRLYERAGMTVERRMDCYRKEL